MSGFHPQGAERRAKAAVLRAIAEARHFKMVPAPDVAWPANNPRGIRHRPSARRRFKMGFDIPVAPREGSLWNCRPALRLYWGESEGKTDRRALSMEEAAELRVALAKAQGGLCSLCGRPIDPVEREDGAYRASFDHTLPRSAGGLDEDNLTLAHNQCNANKANDLPTGCELIWLFVVIARMPRC